MFALPCFAIYDTMVTGRLPSLGLVIGISNLPDFITECSSARTMSHKTYT